MNITTAFFMPLSSAVKRVAFWCLAAFLVLGVVPAQAAKGAEAVSVLFATLKPAEDNLVLSAAMTVRLNKTQEDALKKGLSLHFVTDFELERTRTWWFNESLAEASRGGRLSYNLLTRRYQIETTDSFKAFDTQAEALAELGRAEAWVVGARKLLRPGERHVARLRLRLDQGQLPKPLQINALASGKWEVESEWHAWEINP